MIIKKRIENFLLPFRSKTLRFLEQGLVECMDLFPQGKKYRLLPKPWETATSYYWSRLEQALQSKYWIEYLEERIKK